MTKEVNKQTSLLANLNEISWNICMKDCVRLSRSIDLRSVYVYTGREKSANLFFTVYCNSLLQVHRDSCVLYMCDGVLKPSKRPVI